MLTTELKRKLATVKSLKTDVRMSNRSDEGLTLEKSAFKLLTVANLRFMSKLVCGVCLTQLFSFNLNFCEQKRIFGPRHRSFI